MKTIISALSVFLLLSINSTAQPVITAANKLKAGDWFRTQDAQTSGVAVGDTGANRVWNYSGLIADAGYVAIDSFALPGSFPVPSVFGSTNLMIYSRNSSSTVTDTSYNFFYVTGDTLRNKGYYTPDNNFTFHYQNPIIIFPYFPYTYGYSCADSSIAYYNANNTFTDTGFVSNAYKVTGYGTLTLPGNRTFNNVLQIRRITRQVFGFGTIENAYTFYQTPGNPFPLLEVLEYNGTVEAVRYMTSYYAAPIGPTYTFIGSGNWNNPANWQGGIMPPTTFTPGSSIIISNAPGGSCIINVPVTIPSGVQFIVSPGSNLVLPGNLTIL
jgi:hypothetical protein